MGASGSFSNIDVASRNFKEQARRFYEPQLEDLSLGASQLKIQSFEDLLESLERVNDALRNPELFGVIRMKVTAAASILVSTATESHVELGALPVLLERKKLITDLLRQQRAERPVNSIRDLVSTVPDEELKERLLTELEALRQQPLANKNATRIRKGFAFIAMAMSPDDPRLDDVLDAIKEGATKCGITAERVDEAQSNERITDRMLDSIFEAEFVVVDLSRPRPNVYYEAGFAQGLGKTPVYLAEEGTEIPFDLKDYPVLFYPNMRGLKSTLADRLQAISSARERT